MAALAAKKTVPPADPILSPQKQTSTKSAVWRSIVAGATAGAVEGFATYPFEYAKTMMQFAPSTSTTPAHSGYLNVKFSNTDLKPQHVIIAKAANLQSQNPLHLIYETARTRGISALYVGCSSLVVGTAIKASVRFLAFDGLKVAFVDENGRLSSGGGVVAGIGAGICESLLAVTPFETVKTALIEDGKRAKPRYRGLIHGSMSLIRERGFAGVYCGVVAVTIRQGANSAVRMGSYSWLKGMIQARQKDPSQSLSSSTTFGIGAIAGIVTVYTTMPFDTVKTRMQSLQAKSQYRSTFDCASKIMRHEGAKAFWSGSTARLGRLVFSGGIVFAVYERTMDALKPI